MKKRISFILAAIMLLAVMIPAIPVSAAATDTFSVSNYNSATEFTVSTPTDMLNFYDAVYGQGMDFSGKTVKMANDIVMNDKTDYENWGTTAPANKLEVTGATAVYFKGTFDGDNHTLTGVYSHKVPNSHWTGGVGLFPFVNGTVVIKNLTIDGFYFASDATYKHPDANTTNGAVGTVVGYAQQCNLTITNCTVKNGVVAGDADDVVGGFVGYASGTKLTTKDCAVQSTKVAGSDIAGGAVGVAFAQNGTRTEAQTLIFENFTVENTVTVDGATIGGIIGKSINNATSGGDATYSPGGGYLTYFFIGTTSFKAQNAEKSLHPVGAYEIGSGAAGGGWYLRIGTALGSNGAQGNLTSLAKINNAILTIGVCGTTHTITWSVNGAETTELYADGTLPAFKGNTDKPAEGNVAYVFTGWDTELAPVSADVKYTAVYDSVRNYVVTWVVNGVETKENYAEGTVPTFKGSTDRADEGDTVFYFNGWNTTPVAVTADVTYTAQYNTKTRYTVTWSVDGKETTEKYLEGEVPSFKGVTDKASEGNTAYVFKGWDTTPVAVTGNVKYTAQYDTKVKYTITWVVDGKEITEDYYEGEVPTFKGSASKPADAENTYTFKGWDKTPVAVTGAATYTAEFEAKPKNASPAATETQAPADTAPNTADTAEPEKKGCKSTVSVGLVTVAILGTAATFLARKKED